jgi:hypothetical protein
MDIMGLITEPVFHPARAAPSQWPFFITSAQIKHNRAAVGERTQQKMNLTGLSSFKRQF